MCRSISSRRSGPRQFWYHARNPPYASSATIQAMSAEPGRDALEAPERGQDAHAVDRGPMGRGASAGNQRAASAAAARTVATNASCPSSIPALNDTSASGMSPGGRPASASAPANPKPCSRPNPSAISQGNRRISVGRVTVARQLDRERQDADGDQHLDGPRRHARQPQRRGRQRDAVAQGEGGDGPHQQPVVVAEQEQQAEDEEQVVGAREDVLDAQRHVASRARRAGWGVRER